MDRASWTLFSQEIAIGFSLARWELQVKYFDRVWLDTWLISSPIWISSTTVVSALRNGCLVLALLCLHLIDIFALTKFVFRVHTLADLVVRTTQLLFFTILWVEKNCSLWHPERMFDLWHLLTLVIHRAVFNGLRQIWARMPIAMAATETGLRHLTFLVVKNGYRLRCWAIYSCLIVLQFHWCSVRHFLALQIWILSVFGVLISRLEDKHTHWAFGIN